MKKIILLVSFGLLILVSCEKKSNEAPEDKPINKPLTVIGKWRMAQTSFVSYTYGDNKLVLRTTDTTLIRFPHLRVLNWEFNTDSTYKNTVSIASYSSNGKFRTAVYDNGQTWLITTPSAVFASNNPYFSLIIEQPEPNVLKTTRAMYVVDQVKLRSTLDTVFQTFTRVD